MLITMTPKLQLSGKQTCFVLGRSQARFLGQRLAILTDVPHGFPQHLPLANAGTIPSNRSWLLPFTSFCGHY